MNITLQISDSTYRRLMSEHGRVQGTIGLVTPTEGNFNEHARPKLRRGQKYIRLRHGKATVCDERVRLTLNISLDEANVIPSEAIANESRQASDFIDDVFDRRGY